MKLSEKILMLRKRDGLSQEELAEKLGVSRQAVSRWEVGSVQPDASNVLQLSKLFSVTADYLLNEDYEGDWDVPAVKTATRETRQRLRRVIAWCGAGTGMAGNGLIYVISRIVKVYAPLRYYDQEQKGIRYLYDNVLRVDYGYFVGEYHLQALVALFWVLTIVGLGAVLWNSPALRERIGRFLKRTP